jgi:hypothetical protein
VIAEQIARRNVHESEALVEMIRLRALATAGWAEQHEMHGRRELYFA